MGYNHQRSPAVLTAGDPGSGGAYRQQTRDGFAAKRRGGGAWADALAFSFHKFVSSGMNPEVIEKKWMAERCARRTLPIEQSPSGKEADHRDLRPPVND